MIKALAHTTCRAMHTRAQRGKLKCFKKTQKVPHTGGNRKVKIEKITMHNRPLDTLIQNGLVLDYCMPDLQKKRRSFFLFLFQLK